MMLKMTNAVQWGVFTVAYSYLMNSCSHVQALGWLEQKEDKNRRWTIPSFDHFRLVTLEQFPYTITATVDWGSLYKLL